MALSPTAVALLGLLFASTLKAILILKRAFFSELSKVPGPTYAHLTRLVLKLHILRGERTQYIHSLHQRYGPFVRISPTEIAISDLDAFKRIHRIGDGFPKPDWYMKFSQSEQLPGLFTMTNTKQHAQRRKLFAQPFSNTSIMRFEEIVRSKINLAVSKIRRDAENGTADIFKWFTYMATDVSGQLSFGKSFEMLEKEKKNQYITDLETTMMLSGIRVELDPVFTIVSWLPIDFMRKAVKLPQRLTAYGAQAIENHREYVSKQENKESLSLFSKFLDPSKNQELREDELVQEAANLIVAGSDTTAVSLTYAVYSVLRPENESVRDALLKEINGVKPDAPASEILALPYLKGVITESLRLFGAAPASLPRTVTADGIRFREYYFPAGTMVSTQAFTLHRDANIFQDPESFRPLRWAEPTQAMKDAYSPFGAGSRSCIGLHLAMLELTLGVFRFFKECPHAKLAASTTDESMEIENYFLIAPKSHRCEIYL